MHKQLSLLTLSILLLSLLSSIPIQCAAELPENEKLAENTNTATNNAIAKQAAALACLQQIPSTNANDQKETFAVATPYYPRPKWIDENGNLHHWELGVGFNDPERSGAKFWANIRQKP